MVVLGVYRYEKEKGKLNQLDMGNEKRPTK